MAITRRDRKFIFPNGGSVLWASKLSDGTFGGFRDFGNTPAIGLTIETTEFTHKDADDNVRSTVIAVPSEIERTGTLTVDDIAPENLALFVVGSVSDITQTLEASVTAESINGGKALVADHQYQLGVIAGQPMGARAIAGLAVKDATPTTFELGKDYEADLALGMIRVIPGGALVGKTSVTADYSRPAKTIGNVQADPNKIMIGQLKVVSKPGAGEPLDFFAPYVSIRPSGEMALKSHEAAMSMSFAFTIMTPPDGSSPLYINGRGV